MDESKPSEDLHIRLSKSLKRRIGSYAEQQARSLSEAARDLVEKALASHEAGQLGRHPQGAILHEKLDCLREETDRLERFMREVARTALGIEMVLAHWAAVAGGTRGVNEDQILEEVRKAGEEELRAFLERECPGLLHGPQTAAKGPRGHCGSEP